MILWTIQREEDWKWFKKTGRFYTKKPLHMYDRDWNTFEWRMCYAWMIVQMRKKIGPSPKGVKWPVWSWYQYLDHKRKKPDLRFSEFKRYKEPMARIELEIPDERVLLSDFQLWHIPLNRGLIVKNKKEDDDFDKRLKKHISMEVHKYSNDKPYPEPFHSEMIKSWELIFEMKKFTNSKYVGADSFKEKVIQATFWEAEIDQVKDVTLFSMK